MRGGRADLRATPVRCRTSVMRSQRQRAAGQRTLRRRSWLLDALSGSVTPLPYKRQRRRGANRLTVRPPRRSFDPFRVLQISAAVSARVGSPAEISGPLSHYSIE